jgi:hypothetical protein
VRRLLRRQVFAAKPFAQWRTAAATAAAAMPSVPRLLSQLTASLSRSRRNAHLVSCALVLSDSHIYMCRERLFDSVVAAATASAAAAAAAVASTGIFHHNALLAPSPPPPPPTTTTTTKTPPYFAVVRCEPLSALTRINLLDRSVAFTGRFALHFGGRLRRARAPFAAATTADARAHLSADAAAGGDDGDASPSQPPRAWSCVLPHPQRLVALKNRLDAVLLANQAAAAAATAARE